MKQILQIPDRKPSLLEKFGLYYLNYFDKAKATKKVFEIDDKQLSSKVNKITFWSICFSIIVGVVCVFPSVWVDVKFQNESFIVHYGYVAIVTIVSILIEFYLLFLIALKAVHAVSEIINLHATNSELLQQGPFSVKHILARTALEIPDPELKILGIDPFKQISKKNLLVIGLLYKAKILMSNLIIKYSLLFLIGKTIAGISIYYEAIPVEAFWNSIVIIKVIYEARLRLFGFVLANKIGQNVVESNVMSEMSELSKIGCLRAIGNAVVMTQNYHPNMIVLMLRFQKIIDTNEERQYDNWDMFLETLKNVNEKERYFLLDLFTVAAAFDGKISELENLHLKEAYGNDFEIYSSRLKELTMSLKAGHLNQSLKLCHLDFQVG